MMSSDVCDFNLRGFSRGVRLISFSCFFFAFFYIFEISILGQNINAQPNTSVYIRSLDGPRIRPQRTLESGVCDQ